MSKRWYIAEEVLPQIFDDEVESDNGDVGEVLNPLLDSGSDDDETVDNVVILGVPNV